MEIDILNKEFCVARSDHIALDISARNFKFPWLPLEVMWPRLVANKILKNRLLGSNNFVADFPISDHNSDHSTTSSSTTPNFPEDQANTTNLANNLAQPSLSLDSIFNHHKDVHKFFVSTWNVGGIEPSDDLKMEDWLDPSCDIYVFGFQEIVPLKASNVLGSENNKVSTKWNSLIRKALNKKGQQHSFRGKKLINLMQNNFPKKKKNNISRSDHEMGKSTEIINNVNDHDYVDNNDDEYFKCIISKQMVGILISVWVRTSLCPFIKHQSVSCVGCGIMGCLGNKGSVSVRFQIHETSFCVVCSHLASGGRQGDEKYRNSNAAEILSRTNFPRGPLLDLPQKILDHDRVIWLGDLNYRISLPEATTRLFVDRGDWSALLENDQLRRELMEGQVFEGWHEGAIEFAPTYKYCPNSDTYFGGAHGNKVEKWRAPAWCDRIIWFGEGLKQHFYTRGESKLSDHRPVKALFSVEVNILQRLREFRGFFLSERFDKISSNKFEISSTDDFLCDGKSGFQI